MIDLRFKSKVTEESFKKDSEERLLYRGLASYGAWQALLLAETIVGPYDRFSALHITLLVISVALAALALLHVRSGWLAKLDWELLLLILGCSWASLLPSIFQDYLSQVPGNVHEPECFQALGCLVVAVHTLAIPFRSCYSWTLLLCTVISTFIAFVQSLPIDPEVPSRSVTLVILIGESCLCWWAGWCHEKQSRLSWKEKHQIAVNPRSHNPAAVVPVETSDVVEDVADGPEAVDVPVQVSGCRQDGGCNEPSARRAMDPWALDCFNDVGKNILGGHALRIGANIANFEMKTTKGDFSLYRFLSGSPDKPWTILFSHPNDFTPVCTTELGACHASHAAFEEVGAKMIGLSCNTKESHQAWSRDVLANLGKPSEHELAFPIIADVDRAIVNTLGMLDPEEVTPEGVPLPARGFIILYHTTVKVTSLYPASVGRNVDMMMNRLRSLQESAASALPPSPNPLRIGMTIPNFNVTTTEGDFELFTWLTSDTQKPWTVLVSHPTDLIIGREPDESARSKFLRFANKMRCKFIGVSCDGNELRNASSRDLTENIRFPIVLDLDRRIMNYLGMFDIGVKDIAGFDVPARTFIVLYGATVKLSDMHEATVDRDFDEMRRVLSSFDLTAANHGLATPANWNSGDRVMVGPSMTTEQANASFLDLRIHPLPSGMPYLRSVQCPPRPD